MAKRNIPFPYKIGVLLLLINFLFICWAFYRLTEFQLLAALYWSINSLLGIGLYFMIVKVIRSLMKRRKRNN